MSISKYLKVFCSCCLKLGYLISNQVRCKIETEIVLVMFYEFMELRWQPDQSGEIVVAYTGKGKWLKLSYAENLLEKFKVVAITKQSGVVRKSSFWKVWLNKMRRYYYNCECWSRQLTIPDGLFVQILAIDLLNFSIPCPWSCFCKLDLN